MKHIEIEGKPVEVCKDDLMLYYNNVTIVYGLEFLEEGMTKKEAMEALQTAGFDYFLARAFLAKMREMCNLDFVGGTLNIWGTR